jgi:hypothetical protein
MKRLGSGFADRRPTIAKFLQPDEKAKRVALAKDGARVGASWPAGLAKPYRIVEAVS